ncbi:MAG: CHASE2 domain-containing protein [Candidatus Riflebacteria bacterium]|nr:CHASE2 domain-containing protein [Candidatus Riflebacteria bacterium]
MIVQLFKQLRDFLGPRNFFGIISVISIVVAGLIIFPGWSRWFDYWVMDSVIQLESRLIRPVPEIVVVGIDTPTLEGIKYRWPWPRTVFTDLLKKLEIGKPRLIIVDILLQHLEESGMSAGDRELAETLQKNGNVALIAMFEDALTPRGKENRFFSSADEFCRAATFTGFVGTEYDSDGKVRLFKLRDEAFGLESCAVQTFSSVTGKKFTGRKTHSLLSFALKDGGIPTISAGALLSGQVSTDILRDKIIVLGSNAPILHDFHSTAIGVIPGPMLLAVSIDALLQNRQRSYLSDWDARFFAVLLGLFLAWKYFAPDFRSLIRKGAIILILIVVFSMICFFFAGIFLPVASIVLSWLYFSAVLLSFNTFLQFLELHVMRNESEAAGKVQKLLAPKTEWTISSDYSCRGINISCQSVGGDYLDFFEMPDKTFLFIIGDVTGHGFSAAMVCSIAKTISATLYEKNMLTVSSWISTVNNMVFNLLKKKKNLTALVAHLNPETHLVHIGFAGHSPVYHVKSDGSVTEISISNYPVGCRKTIQILEGDYPMEEGDSMVFYSDGIVEALNYDEKQYGFDAWKDHLSRVIPKLKSDQPLEDVLQDVRNFTKGRPFDDDVTLIVLQRLKHSPDHLQEIREF